MHRRRAPAASRRLAPGLALLIALAGLSGCGPEPLPPTGALFDESFRSEIVADEYLLRVRLPPGYEDDERLYPLVVQLDPTYAGLREHEITVGLISANAAAGAWEEAIVLGVDYPDPFTRHRDYVPPTPLDPEHGGEGADRFFRVLRDEILPQFEARYRVDPERRILVGHSNGGVFAWYAALRHAPTEPPLFSGLIAADCGYDEALFTLERWHAERSEALPVRLYASRAVYNGAAHQIGFRAMIERVRGRGYSGLTLVDEEIETDHGGVIAPSFEAGLDLMLGGAS